MPKKYYKRLHVLIIPFKKNLIKQLLISFIANFSAGLEILGKRN